MTRLHPDIGRDWGLKRFVDRQHAQDLFTNFMEYVFGGKKTLKVEVSSQLTVCKYRCLATLCHEVRTLWKHCGLMHDFFEGH